ncbi:hypothetical protein GJ744_001059 [Endocarpon pusillum]|uniref:Uncharacterized protein n=1 Tax=Endocarpon pusillum TaxID=364733 RepID=A0A8H7E0V6_9EURO|nr:hypothetical protein GJ744_001059 [Endocarpon pusillum]
MMKTCIKPLRFCSGRKETSPLIPRLRKENDDWCVQKLRSEDENGMPYHLEAKMDTGADANLISLEAAEAYRLLIEEVEGPETAFKVGSSESTGIDGIVRLYYSADNPNTDYTGNFYVKVDLPHDIILGMPF